MDLDQFDYPLPEDRIAHFPCEKRDGSKLMAINRRLGEVQHTTFTHIVDFLNPGDLIIGNNSKVIPARIAGFDSEERENGFLLLEEKAATPPQWTCLVRNTKRCLKERSFKFFDEVEGIISEEGDETLLSFPSLTQDSLWDNLAHYGTPPLPPYIKREIVESDWSTYQTVFASAPGSVAAPTAGLHFTKDLIGEIQKKGVGFELLTLHVGYGTFAPIRELSTHKMHSERYEISPNLFEKIQSTKKNGKKVIALGTTSLRALESVPLHGLTGRTDLFITPGFAFKTVDSLITNFHLPKSSLFVLVSALLGIEKARSYYEEAVRQNYRFFSYGDAMFID